MHYSTQKEAEEFRPRLIVWQITPPGAAAERTDGDSRPDLTPNERHLILEGISRTAKPIVVLTGDHLPQRTDLFELVQYGFAIGLKMIVEAKPDDISNDTIRRYLPFGPRIFRVMIDDAVRPGTSTRYELDGKFQTLERCVKLLMSSGFEIHLSASIEHPDIRQLALEHDYAFRRSASGFYCHLAIKDGDLAGEPAVEGENEIDTYIDAVASLKQFCPPNMYYLSPQCVKYGYREIAGEPMTRSEREEGEKSGEWRHWCLGGKSFAFITHDGIVKICSQLPATDGDLRKCGYDFGKIWESSDTFRLLREGVHTCSETREFSKEASKV